MKRTLTSSILAMVALVGLSGSANAQSISTLVAGTQDTNGYLWQFLIDNDKGVINKNISHFVLEICDNALNSIIVSTIKYSEVGLSGGGTLFNQVADYEFKPTTGSPDPTTGKYGIKFDDGFDDISYRVVEFYLDKDLGTATKNVTFKAGTFTHTTTFVGPGCTEVVKIPEPGSVALLGLGALAMGAGIARRRR
jgi:hypothetical protein